MFVSVYAQCVPHSLLPSDFKQRHRRRLASIVGIIIVFDVCVNICVLLFIFVVFFDSLLMCVVIAMHMRSKVCMTEMDYSFWLFSVLHFRVFFCFFRSSSSFLFPFCHHRHVLLWNGRKKIVCFFCFRRRIDSCSSGSRSNETNAHQIIMIPNGEAKEDKMEWER